MEVSPAKYQDQVEESLQDARVKGYDISQPIEVVIGDTETPGVIPDLTEFPTIDKDTGFSEDEIRDPVLVHEVIHFSQIQRALGRRSREVERRVSTLKDKAHEISPNYPQIQPSTAAGGIEELMSVKAAAMYSFNSELFDEVYERTVSTANPFNNSQPVVNLEAELDSFPEAQEYLEPIMGRMEDVGALPVESTGEVFAWLATFEYTRELADSRPVVNLDWNTNRISSPDFYEGYGVQKEYVAREMKKVLDTYHSAKREGISDVDFAVEAVNAGMEWFENEPQGPGDTHAILEEHSEVLRPYV